MRGDLNTNREAAKEIINAVNEYFGVDVVNDKTRLFSFVMPRHIARYLVRSYCKGFNLEMISDIFCVNHATVLNSINVVDGFISVRDTDVTFDLNTLIAKIETECDVVKSLCNNFSKNTYIENIFNLLDDVPDDRLKEVESIVKNYKEAYKKIDSLIENPLSVV